MIKEKLKIVSRVQTRKIPLQSMVKGALKYENQILPISESLARDLDEALKRARSSKSKKYTSKEIFARFGL